MVFSVSSALRTMLALPRSRLVSMWSTLGSWARAFRLLSSFSVETNVLLILPKVAGRPLLGSDISAVTAITRAIAGSIFSKTFFSRSCARSKCLRSIASLFLNPSVLLGCLRRINSAPTSLAEANSKVDPVVARLRYFSFTSKVPSICPLAVSSKLLTWPIGKPW